MECTKCHLILDINMFSYKNVKQKIFFLHCDKCREKIALKKDKEAERLAYETIKKTNLIKCPICHRQYISFRTFHTIRHNNTKIHIQSMKSSAL